MPFDGTLLQPHNKTVPHLARKAPVIAPPRETTANAKLWLLLPLFIILGCTLIEGYYPNRGPLTLLFSGPDMVRQNVIAYDLWHHAKKLRFAVGIMQYTVATPDHDLTAEEQTAWLGFAKLRNYPVYSVDGPLAVDP
jgi:hypothetical protein